MSYTYRPPEGWPPSDTREKITHEFKLWNDFDAGAVTDWDLPMKRNGVESAAVVFALRGNRINVSVATFPEFGTNLRVAYLNIRDMRLAEVRGGGAAMREAYLQIAAPPSKRSAWEVLGLVEGQFGLIDAAYRVKAREIPDPNGAGEEALKELNLARDELKAIGLPAAAK